MSELADKERRAIKILRMYKGDEYVAEKVEMNIEGSSESYGKAKDVYRKL